MVYGETMIKKILPIDILSSLSLEMIPVVSKYNTACCATCGTAMPIINKIEDFPPIEYYLYTNPPMFKGAFEGIIFKINGLFCCNNHENMIEFIVSLDLLRNRLAADKLTYLLSSLKGEAL
jgi:hypothetical protein